MNDESQKSIPRAAGNLLGSLSQLGSTLVDYGKARLSQFGDGIGEEIQRATGIVIWSAVIVMLLGMGLLLAGLTVVVAFWDTVEAALRSLFAAPFKLMLPPSATDAPAMPSEPESTALVLPLRSTSTLALALAELVAPPI